MHELTRPRGRKETAGRRPIGQTNSLACLRESKKPNAWWFQVTSTVTHPNLKRVLNWKLVSPCFWSAACRLDPSGTNSFLSSFPLFSGDLPGCLLPFCKGIWVPALGTQNPSPSSRRLLQRLHIYFVYECMDSLWGETLPSTSTNTYPGMEKKF